MRLVATQMYRSQREFADYAIQVAESLPKSQFAPIVPCIDAFCLEGGINMLELPGTVGVIVLALKSRLQ